MSRSHHAHISLISRPYLVHISLISRSYLANSYRLAHIRGALRTMCPCRETSEFTGRDPHPSRGSESRLRVASLPARMCLPESLGHESSARRRAATRCWSGRRRRCRRGRCPRPASPPSPPSPTSPPTPAHCPRSRPPSPPPSAPRPSSSPPPLPVLSPARPSPRRAPTAGRSSTTAGEVCRAASATATPTSDE